MFVPFGLGDRVRDPITGAQGIVVCITTWLHGCIRVGIQPEDLDKDGKTRESIHFDQSQLALVQAGVHTPMVLAVAEPPKPEERRSSGGPAREGAGFSR